MDASPLSQYRTQLNILTLCDIKMTLYFVSIDNDFSQSGFINVYLLLLLTNVSRCSLVGLPSLTPDCLFAGRVNEKWGIVLNNVHEPQNYGLPAAAV